MTPAPDVDLASLPPALTVKQAAHLWNCSPDVIYEAVQRGECPVPVLRIGRLIRLPRADVLAAVGLDTAHECHGCGGHQ